MTSWNSVENAEPRPPLAIVGVGAGIAAYKVVQVVRDLIKSGVDVRVIPTPRSAEFVGLETWREVSQAPVETGVFHREGPGHVHLAREADLIVLAPATADLLARARMGIADDLLTATLLASSAPVIAFPAMHSQMWLAPSTAENVRVLRERGWTVQDPASGALSSGDQGIGRLPDPDLIVAQVQRALTGPQRLLEGRRILITAGGTQEAIDPVRFIGNRSTGTQGIALAVAARDMGAEVILVAANISAVLPSNRSGITLLPVTTAAQMKDAVFEHLPLMDALVMTAAVADFRPATTSEQKIKKRDGEESLVLELTKTDDILAAVSASELRPSVLVGFAAETGDAEQVLSFGQEKAKRKRADILALNSVGPSSGFGARQNQLTYLDAQGNVLGGLEGTKDALAVDLMQQVALILDERNSS